MRLRSRAVAGTARQNAALAKAHEFVVAARFAAQRNGQGATSKAYGVGRALNPRVVKRVTAALQQVIQTADDNPEQARSIGLLSEDIDAMRNALADVIGADAAQEQARAAAPLTTQARNQCGRRILAAIDQIVAAAKLEFVGRAAILRQFDTLIGAGNPRKKKGKKKG